MLLRTGNENDLYSLILAQCQNMSPVRKPMLRYRIVEIRGFRNSESAHDSKLLLLPITWFIFIFCNIQWWSIKCGKKYNVSSMTPTSQYELQGCSLPLSSLLRGVGEHYYVGQRRFKANRPQRKQPKLSIRRLGNKDILFDH